MPNILRISPGIKKPVLPDRVRMGFIVKTNMAISEYKGNPAVGVTAKELQASHHELSSIVLVAMMVHGTASSRVPPTPFCPNAKRVQID